MTKKFHWDAEKAEKSAELYFSHRAKIELQEQGGGAGPSRREGRYLRRKKRQKKQWTFAMCMAVASEFSSRTEWRSNSIMSYRAAVANGWRERCCAHMERATKWTVEALRDDARRFRSRTEWQRLSPSAYQLAWKKGLLDECCAHMSRRKSERGSVGAGPVEQLAATGRKRVGPKADANERACEQQDEPLAIAA